MTKRMDLDGAPVPAQIQNVIKRTRRSALKAGDATVDTCEHCLSAVAAHAIDNLIIELDGPEVPAMDGSSLQFYEALTQAGREPQDAPRRYLEVKTPVVIREDDAMVAALPSNDDTMQVVYELDYTGVSPVIGRQLRTFDLGGDEDYGQEIAPSRTFSLEAEAEAARKAGLFPHLTVDTALVVGADGPLGKNAFRFDDEPVRHKILDLIGDLYLLGAPIKGRIVAYKSGHPMNHRLARELLKQHTAATLKDLAHHHSVLDVRKLFRMMPHRYPMLLVDRVVELVQDQRAVGVKNVTINEPFFQGHYPTSRQDPRAAKPRPREAAAPGHPRRPAHAHRRGRQDPQPHRPHALPRLRRRRARRRGPGQVHDGRRRRRITSRHHTLTSNPRPGHPIDL